MLYMRRRPRLLVMVHTTCTLVGLGEVTLVIDGGTGLSVYTKKKEVSSLTITFCLID